MNQTRHFVNEGFGWECRRCREAFGEDAARDVEETRAGGLPRFFREGEAEEGGPRLSTPSRARWKDETRRALLCPACGVEEEFAG